MKLITAVLLAMSIAGSAAAQPKQRLWVSGGLGAGGTGGVAMASATYSRGPAVLIARLDAAGGITGDAVNDRAFLVGARSSGSSGFVLGAIGIGRARHSVLSSDVRPRRDSPQTAVTFEVKGQGGGSLAQLGVGMVAVIGPNQASYAGVVVSVNLGWFGRDTR